MIRSIIAASFVVLITIGCAPPTTKQESPNNGQQMPTISFINKVFQASDGSKSKYVIFVPHDYDGTKRFPAILTLHGLSQSGTDGFSQVERGLAVAIRKREATFPFITVFPQSQNRTWIAETDDGKRAMAILDEVQQDFQVDSKRVYLTGYSMGGEGTFSLAAAHPKRCAAIVPICGGYHISVAPRLKDIPCWCFVGDADAPSTVFLNRIMMRAVKKTGGRPIYHEYPGVGHNSFDITYDDPNVYEWLLLQKRP